ncbi:MAG: tetratricopeptide repeat protein, partial [Smithella sp.]
WGIPLLFPREYTRKKILFPVATAFLIILAALTWQQCGYWKNNTTLFSHALRVTKDNYLAHGNLASALLEKGKIREAIYHYNKALSIMPDYDVAYYNLGIAYYALGQYQRAIENFKEAIRILPNYAAAYYNSGIIYIGLRQYQRAIDNYNKAICINPDYAYAYNDRALAYLNQGNNKLGCPDAQKACALGVCKVLEWSKNNGFCR